MKIVVDSEGAKAIEVLLDLYLKTNGLNGKQDVDYILSNLKVKDDNTNNNANKSDNMSEWKRNQKATK